MKILLINPPRSPYNNIYKYADPDAKKFIHQKLIGPPLGLLTLASYLKDYDVKIFDIKAEYDLNKNAPELNILVKNILSEINPDVVGVTFIASEFPYGMDILKTVKEYNPAILTVAGGLHATLCPNDFHRQNADIVCPGQAVRSFKDLIEAKINNIDFENVPGIMINSKDGLKKTKMPYKECIPVKKNFIMPDRSHLKKWLDAYRVGGRPEHATYVYTSLGCPYKCTFCSIWPLFNGKFYQRDVEEIIAELRTLDDYQIVRFADANTIIDPKFINKLCDRILEENIKKDFIMDIRTDTAVEYPELIDKLTKCGLKVVICGFESYREDELKKYNKNAKAGLIEKAIEVFHKNNISIRGNYVIPNDYSEDDFKALSDYASKHKVVYAGYTILTPMPGTVFYKEIKEQIIDFDLAKYNFFNCVLKTKLPIDKFYENVGNLWLIKKGQDVI